MEKRKLKEKLKKIDMSRIDTDSFAESILSCVTRAKDICTSIDSRIHDTAIIAYIPYTTAFDQCNEIIEHIWTKKEIIRMYKIFKEWYAGLDYKKKYVYQAYRVREKKTACQDLTEASCYKDKIILPFARAFLKHLEVMLNYDVKELIKNPFVYSTYAFIYHRNKIYKKRGFWESKGGYRRDYSTNERCHCCCLRNQVMEK